MKTVIKLSLSLVLLGTTLACAFVKNLVFQPTPGPQGSTPIANEVFGLQASTPTLSVMPVPIGTIEPITCTDDQCLQACLDRLDTVLQIQPFDSIGNSIYEETDAEFNLVIYQVDDDEITDPAILYVPLEYRKFQEATESHLRIWDFYVAMVPSSLRTFVSEFVIYTDGSSGDSAAWVDSSPSEEGLWRVGIDLLDSDYPVYLADTLVHETAHLLTLNTSQVPIDEDEYYYYDEKQGGFRKCEQYAVDGGCSLPDSYINLFYQEFWKESYAEWWELEQEAQNAASDDEYFEIKEQFYDSHEDWFLNSYAATNVEEDMAESFAFFVLNPKPSGDSVYERKVAFYYEFPELVEYRRQMIEGLCSYIR